MENFFGFGGVIQGRHLKSDTNVRHFKNIGNITICRENKIKLPRGRIRVVSALFFVVHIVTPVAHTYYVVLGSSYGLPFSSFTGKTGS